MGFSYLQLSGSLTAFAVPFRRVLWGALPFLGRERRESGCAGRWCGSAEHVPAEGSRRVWRSLPQTCGVPGLQVRAGRVRGTPSACGYHQFSEARFKLLKIRSNPGWKRRARAEVAHGERRGRHWELRAVEPRGLCSGGFLAAAVFSL